MKLKCKTGSSTTKLVDVNPDDQLNVLLKKLKIDDLTTKFIYNGKSYDMASILTFSHIGLINDAMITVINAAIAGYLLK